MFDSFQARSKAEKKREGREGKRSAFERKLLTVPSRRDCKGKMKTNLEIHSSSISFTTSTSSIDRVGDRLLFEAAFAFLMDDVLVKRSLASETIDLGGAKRRGSSLDRISCR